MAQATHQTVVLDALLSEPFFQERHQRSVSRVVAWLRKSHAAAPKALRSNLIALLEEEMTGTRHSCLECPVCDRVLGRTARTLLRNSSTLPVELVDDFPSAVELLDLVADHRVFTDDVLRDLMDLAPGGVEYLKRTGASELRARLETEHGDRFTWARVGHPRLREPDPRLDGGDFLSEPSHHFGTHHGGDMIVAANRILSDPAGYFSQFVAKALEEAKDADELAAEEAFLCAVAPQRPYSGLWHFPPAPETSKAIAGYAEARPHLDDVAGERLQDLLTVFCQTEHFHQKSRGFPGTMPLRDLVWSQLAKSTRLPGVHTGSAGRNLELLSALLGTEPTRAALALHPALNRLCRSAAKRAVVVASAEPETAADDAAAAELVTIADVHALLRRHVDANGRLPGYTRLGSAVVDRVEQLMGLPYSAVVERLHRNFGWARPSRSRNEQTLERIAEEAYPSSAADMVVEWSDWDRKTAQWRVDAYLPVTDDQLPLLDDVGTLELFLEADGEGHFAQVHNWNLDQQRTHDAAKAAELGLRARKRGPGLLCAVHHRALTGPNDLRLTPGVLRRIVASVAAAGHWWCYVRPVGCDDDRAAPGPTKSFPGQWGPLEVRVLQNPNLNLSKFDAAA